jgi:glutaredoxin
MRPSLIFRMYSARVTLFTKSDCGLCDTAKARLVEVQKRRTVEYKEVDIMKEDNKKWYNMYAFDVPVLHVSRVMHTYSKPDIVSPEKKLMHRFTVDDVEALIEEAEERVQAG